MNKIKILYILLIFVSLYMLSCSHIIDPIWNYNAAGFSVDATDDRVNEILLTWEGTDLDPSNLTLPFDSSKCKDYQNGTKFWSYFIYRTTENPFNSYEFIYEETDISKTSYRDVNSIDNQLLPGVKYYYRVVVVSVKMSKTEEKDSDGKVIGYECTKPSFDKYKGSGWDTGEVKG